MGIKEWWEDTKSFFGYDRPAPSDEEKKASKDKFDEKHITPIGDAATKLMKGVPEKEGNYIKFRITSGIKAAIDAELKKPTPNQAELKKAIIKVVDDYIPQEEPTETVAKHQYQEDRNLLEINAGNLAQRAIDLKGVQGEKAIETINKQVGGAGPMLPVSNATLAFGGGATALALMSDNSLGNWTSFRGIAIKLGIIAAGIGVGAYVSGDYKAVLPPKKKDDSKAASPT